MTSATVCVIPQRRGPAEDSSLSAVPYYPLIPDGEYLALCTHAHHDKQSRRFGERVYVYLKIFDGEYSGTTIRMFLKPNKFPKSNFYRAWSIAHGGPPRCTRNTKMSARIFKGKLFKILTTTVKPRHEIVGPDGKMRPGPPLPESFWYSKVACLLSLEATNDLVTPVFTTPFPSKSFPDAALAEGMVGRRELGDGSKQESPDFAVRDGHHHNTPQHAGQEQSCSAPSPQGGIEGLTRC